MHLAQLANIPILRGEIQLSGVENGAGLFERPRKVVAIVVEANIGILGGEESAALAVGHGRVEPRYDLSRGFEEVLAYIALEAMNVVAQKLRVVVEHLLEVRNDPALVDAVAMKASRELIVNAAARHLFERRDEGFAGRLVVGAHGHLEQQIKRSRMRKLGLRAEASVAGIELAYD